MIITKETVEHIAHLSGLPLDSAECERQRQSLEGMLDYMDILRRLDTEGVSPLVHLADESPLRADEISPSYPQEQMLAGAPERQGEAFSVPETVKA